MNVRKWGGFLITSNCCEERPWPSHLIKETVIENHNSRGLESIFIMVATGRQAWSWSISWELTSQPQRELNRSTFETQNPESMDILPNPYHWYNQPVLPIWGTIQIHEPMRVILIQTSTLHEKDQLSKYKCLGTRVCERKSIEQCKWACESVHTREGVSSWLYNSASEHVRVCIHEKGWAHEDTRKKEQ